MAQMYEEKPEPGDLIEIFRIAYQHWAVYIGDGFIVHLAPPPEIPGGGFGSSGSLLSHRAVVVKEKLKTVAGKDRWKINNSLDKEYEPRPSAVIVKEACALVGAVLPYSIITQNCEHFVNELRYGKAESRQVRKAGQAALAAGVRAVGGLGFVSLAGAALSRGDKEKKRSEQ